MPHRILIVDDDPNILNMLGKYLGKTLKYDVAMATSGSDAIDLALQQHFDLCIIDVRMPGLSGTETYMRLRNILPEVEAIFFTADKEFENRMDFLRFSLPAERVLTKPITDLSMITRLIIGILGPPVA
jgi:CheY-like chemotaxis protein